MRSPLEKIHILLIDKDLRYFSQIHTALNATLFKEAECLLASTVAEATLELTEKRYDVVLFNLAEPSEHLARLLKLEGHPPIMVLGACDEEDTTVLDALSMGVQDYLNMHTLTPSLLEKSLLYSIKRERAHEGLREVAMMDELTRLYNRRGFERLAEQLLSFSQRNKTGFFLILFDINKFKVINDTHGHLVGDQTLIKVAHHLTSTFRKHDVVARWGGDEFVVLVTHTPVQQEEDLRQHIEEKLHINNTSLSFGMCYYDFNEHSTVAELIERADLELYEKKRKHSHPS